MNWRTNRAITKLRTLGRALGLNRLVGRVLSRGGYEDKFSQLMLEAVQPGDVVWDVGANVGLYTTKFADLVGSAGQVIAFEPSPINFESLSRAAGARENVKLLECALGATEGEVSFIQGGDATGATSRITDGAGSADGMSVKVSTWEQVVATELAPAPNFLKIDTEGFELDVLTGAGSCLKSGGLRVLCIEIHFGVLKSRGLSDAPSLIEALLQENGFEVTWADFSHVVATKAG